MTSHPLSSVGSISPRETAVLPSNASPPAGLTEISPAPSGVDAGHELAAQGTRPSPQAGVVLQLSGLGRDAQANAAAGTEAQSLARELLLAALGQNNFLSALFKTSAGDATLQALVAKLSQLALSQPIAGAQNSQSGSAIPGLYPSDQPVSSTPAPPANASTGASSGEPAASLFQQLRTSLQSLLEQTSGLFKATTPTAGAQAPAADAPTASSAGLSTFPSPGAAETSLQLSPAQQAVLTDLFSRLGVEMPPALKALLTPATVSSAEASASLVTNASGEGSVQQWTRQVAEALGALASVPQALEAHLLKSDFIQTTPTLIASLLHEGSPTGAAKPDSAARQGAPNGLSDGLSAEHVTLLLKTLAEYAPALTPQGREQLARLEPLLRQIQQALAQQPGAGEGSAARPGDPRPAELERSLLTEAIRRGFTFELETRTDADLDGLVARLRTLGVEVQQAVGAHGEPAKWQLTLPGQKPESGPPLKLDEEHSARTLAEKPEGGRIAAQADEPHRPFAAAAPHGVIVAQGAFLTSLDAPDAHPESRQDLPNHSREDQRTNQQARADQSLQAAGQQQIFHHTIHYPPLLAHMIAFYMVQREGLSQGKAPTVLQEPPVQRLLLEYTPIEILPPAAAASDREPAPIRFGPPASEAVSDAVPL